MNTDPQGCTTCHGMADWCRTCRGTGEVTAHGRPASRVPRFNTVGGYVSADPWLVADRNDWTLAAGELPW